MIPTDSSGIFVGDKNCSWGCKFCKGCEARDVCRARNLEQRKEKQPPWPLYKYGDLTIGALRIEEVLLDADLARYERRESTGAATLITEEEGFKPVEVSKTFVDHYRPEAGGYVTLYRGEHNYAPKEVFEKTYEKI